MTESGAVSRESDEDSELSISDIMAFQKRIEVAPDSVSDDEIRAEYGDGISPNDLRELFRRSTFRNESKAPRASARAKLRRRLVWLDRSLEEVEDAVGQVLGSPGRTNKQSELDNLLAAIEQFRTAVGLSEPQSPSACDPDLLERLLNIRHREQRTVSPDANGTDG